jgi:hypothetical protein
MNIVFAHFKTKFPKHLILNLQRTAKLFPEHQVVLITDQDVSKLDIQGLTMFFFDESPEWLEIEALLEHPKDFRGNFWFTSLARFVAISAFMQLNDCPLVHIESDVIISSDFPFEKFSKIESIFAYPVINDNLAIASCLFIRDKQAAMFLENFTLKSVRENPSTTDMYVLHDLFSQHPGKVQLLPSGPPERDALVGVSPDFFDEILGGVSLFNGIFDGSAIGRYLFGDDPRNNRGFSVLRRKDPQSYIDASKLEFTVLEEREFPFTRSAKDSTQLPIFAIHVHSKNLRLFESNNLTRELVNSVKNSKHDSEKIFSFNIFLIGVRNAIKRRIKILMVS